MDHLLVSIAAGGGILLLVQIGLSWRLLRLARVIARYEEKLAHLADAVSLLTETTEAGFRAVATEVERLGGQTGPKRPTRLPAARLAAAARRGRSVQEIAALEQVSEGEVRLRLHFAEQARAERAHDTSAGARGPASGTEHAGAERAAARRGE